MTKPENTNGSIDRGVSAYLETSAQLERDELILNHLWLVRHLAGKLLVQLPPHVDVDNLESAGVLGLVEAASRFDSGRGVEFKAYCSMRIRGAMLDELRRNCPLPQKMIEQVNLVRKAQKRLPPPITVEALKKATGLSEDTILDCLAAVPLTQMQSLNHVGHLWYGESSDPPDANLQREDLVRSLADAIAALPKRERLVVTLYYMKDLRQKEIGSILNLSESRISRLLTAAELQLREHLQMQNT